MKLQDERNWIFRLYTAGEAPNSLRAIANLAAIGQEYLQSCYKVEIVDILADPLHALNDGILVTPTLVRIAPPPIRKILGNLNDREKVLLALGLAGGLS